MAVVVLAENKVSQTSFFVDNRKCIEFMIPDEFMLKTLAGEGIVFDEILIDGSMPGDGSPRRKPGIGMVEKYLNEWLDRFLRNME